MSGKLLSYLFIVAAAFCWGMAGVFAKELLPHGYTSYELTLLKTVVGLVVILILSCRKYKELFKLYSWSDFFTLMGVGVLGYSLYGIAYVMTVNSLGVGIAGAMLYSKCMFVMIFSRILFGSKITPKKMLAMCMTIFGCLFISGAFSETNVNFTLYGLMWGIASGMFFATYDVLSKKVLDKYSSDTVNVYTFLIAIIFISFLTSPVDAVTRVIETNTLGWLILYGVVVSTIPYILYTKGLAKVDVSIAAVLSTFELLTANTLGIIMYGEPLTVLKVVGIILVIGAVCILNLAPSEEK